MDAASGGGLWASATVGQALAIHDRLRTGEDSRAAVRMTDLSVLRIDELTQPIHDRMPVVLDKADIRPPLNGKAARYRGASKRQVWAMKIRCCPTNGGVIRAPANPI